MFIFSDKATALHSMPGLSAREVPDWHALAEDVPALLASDYLCCCGKGEVRCLLLNCLGHKHLMSLW